MKHNTANDVDAIGFPIRDYTEPVTDGGTAVDGTEDIEPPYVTVQLNVDWLADIPNHVEPSDILTDSDVAKQAAENLSMGREEVLDYNITVETEVEWPDDDPDSESSHGR